MTGDYAYKLEVMDCLREKVIERAIIDLSEVEGGNILDAGCGIGGNLPLLARCAGRKGHVTGLDISDEFISLAEQSITDRKLEAQVSLVQGDINDLSFGDGEFDCVVSIDCAGYPYSSDPAALMHELGRVVRPGGTLALLGWSFQQLLPGYQLLESKLNTASSLTVYSGAGNSPETHFFAAPGWFRGARFTGVEGRSYLGDIIAPLDEGQKEAVTALFDMLWSDSHEAVSNAELQLFQQITAPGAAEFILDRPDYYGFFVYTCFSGQAP